jgi:hypothetical protein
VSPILTVKDAIGVVEVHPDGVSNSYSARTKTAVVSAGTLNVPVDGS